MIYHTVNEINNEIRPSSVGHICDVSEDSEAWFHFELKAKTLQNFSLEEATWIQLLGENAKPLAYVDLYLGKIIARIYDNAGNHTNVASNFSISSHMSYVFDIMYRDDLTTCTLEVYLGGKILIDVSRDSTGSRTMPSLIQLNSPQDIADWEYSKFFLANDVTIGLENKVITFTTMNSHSDPILNGRIVNLDT